MTETVEVAGKNGNVGGSAAAIMEVEMVVDMGIYQI